VSKRLVVTEYENLKAAQDQGGFAWAGNDDVIGDPFKGLSVADVWKGTDSGSITGLPGSIEVSAEDGHRIAASWNAVEGIRTADLAKWAPDGVAKMRAALGRCVHEMDCDPYGCLACGAKVPINRTDDAERDGKHRYIEHAADCWIKLARTALAACPEGT
jgi:hypothetical protein